MHFSSQGHRKQELVCVFSWETPPINGATGQLSGRGGDGFVTGRCEPGGSLHSEQSRRANKTGAHGHRGQTEGCRSGGRCGGLGERGEGWESQNSPRDGKPSTENPVTNVVRSMDAAGGVRDLSGESVCKLCNCLKHYGIHWKLI